MNTRFMISAGLMEFAARIMSSCATTYKVSSPETGRNGIHKIGPVVVPGVSGCNAMPKMETAAQTDFWNSKADRCVTNRI